MPPRKTTDFASLFESLIEDLHIQVAASVDKTLTEFSKRLDRLERRIDSLDPDGAEKRAKGQRRQCLLCARDSVARGLCSAHYQQWRYRERKSKLHRGASAEHAEHIVPKPVPAEKVPPEALVEEIRFTPERKAPQHKEN